MDHHDHVRLIAGAFHPSEPAGAPVSSVWADFGAGSGAFTLAIRDLTGPAVEISAVDRDRSALASLQEAMARQFPQTTLHLIEGDIRRLPELPLLDGIVAANALHYVDRRQQPETLRRWTTRLKPSGRIVLVEYDTDQASSWLPYPISFRQLGPLAHEAGLPAPRLLATHPSRWGGGIYSAMIVVDAE